MRKLLRKIRPVLVCFFIMTLLCGVIYPGIVTAVAQTAFPSQANGSTITVTLKDGSTKNYGSELIEQEFTQPQYLIGRPLGITNLNPSSKEEQDLVTQRIYWWHALDPDNTADIPMDLVTSSGSGVDPSISPEAAEYQVSRIARARGLSEEAVRQIIRNYTTGKLFGFWGEASVNVLKVNLALDGLI